VAQDESHRALYQVFLDVRDAAAGILENTTVADIVSGRGSGPRSRRNRSTRGKPVLIEGKDTAK